MERLWSRVLKTLVLIIVGLAPSFSNAGIFETLSEASLFVSSGQVCPTVDSARVRLALSPVCRDTPNAFGLSPVPDILEAAERTMGNSEDEYFKGLAQQHARELSCSANFASSDLVNNQTAMSQILSRVELLRQTKQNLLSASRRLSSNRNLPSQHCPNTVEELSSVPAQLQEFREACQEIIQSRISYQTILNAIPLSNVPGLMTFLDSYSNSAVAKSNPELLGDLQSAYRQVGTVLSREATRLRAQADSPAGPQDRTLRRSLLQDPRIIRTVIERSNDPAALAPVQCRADGRYGAGANALDTGLLVGSIALSGGAGLVARSGAVALRLRRGLGIARADGLISSNAMRFLNISALGVDSIAAYSQIDQACGSTPPLALSTQCVSAPSINQIEQESCLLNIALSALPLTLLSRRSADTQLQNTINSYSLFRNERHQFQIINPRIREGRFNLNSSEIGRNPNAVYIGVANHADEGSHHYYLVAGNQRYDGRPLFTPSITRELGDRSVAMPEGVVFQVNVPEESMTRIQSAIQQRAKSRNATCFHGLCNVLAEADIVVPSMGERVLRLRPVVQELADGDVFVNGSRLAQGQVRAFATSEEQLSHYLTSLRSAEAAAGTQFVVIAGTYAAGLSYLSGWIIYQVVTQ
ncbi:MAG: hypothetical protein ACK5WZ_11010 [Pseudobdellovibrionaceae bacterium]